MKVTFAGRTAKSFSLCQAIRGRTLLTTLAPPKLTTGGTCFVAILCLREAVVVCLKALPNKWSTSLGKLRQLPDRTRVWCAHEYTLKNLRFAITVDPNNVALQQRLEAVNEARSQGQATVPADLALEKNKPIHFCRWDHPELQKAVAARSPVQTFARPAGQERYVLNLCR